MKNTILRILFVDDDDDVRFMVKRWLGRHSYEVSTAESMACGLQLARSEAFDLYLFDTKLADGTGQELCERVREFDQQTPIIFYSGEHPARLCASARLDIQDYVMKPELEGLRKAIFRAMNIVKPALAAI